MGAGRHGGFGHTKGCCGSIRLDLQFFALKSFEPGGHLTQKSFEDHREGFLGKAPAKIASEMKKHGYKVEIRRSTNPASKAKRIIVKNVSKSRNVSQILVSPGSKHHGETPYVKVSTIDIGKYKIAAFKDKYISDGKENTKVYFPRKEKK